MDSKRGLSDYLRPEDMKQQRELMRSLSDSSLLDQRTKANIHNKLTINDINKILDIYRNI